MGSLVIGSLILCKVILLFNFIFFLGILIRNECDENIVMLSIERSVESFIKILVNKKDLRSHQAIIRKKQPSFTFYFPDDPILACKCVTGIFSCLNEFPPK